jgi:ABC-type spermidine/putrescine transport system permease subunit I
LIGDDDLRREYPSSRIDRDQPLALIYDDLPYMVLALWISAEFVDRRLVGAARDLGATPWRSFRLVVPPQIKPAFAAAYSVGVILSLTELIIAISQLYGWLRFRRLGSAG